MISLQPKSRYSNVTRKLFFYIVQIGAGANGGYILQSAAQMLNIFGCATRSRYIVADPDVVESKNLNNQLFIPKDIGHKKADILAKRYGTHYAVPIASFSERYVEDIKTMESLFSHTSYTGCNSHEYKCIPILIGAVDNNYSRQVMNEYFESAHNLVYIDVGVEAAVVPQDDRKREQWTKEEWERNQSTGWTGQVVCGLKLGGKTILPPVAERFPDILTDTDSIAPSELSCANRVAIEPQRLMTNRMAALCVTTYLNDLFGEEQITNAMTFFHAKKGYMRSEVAQPIQVKERGVA